MAKEVSATKRDRWIDRIFEFFGMHIPYGRKDKLHIAPRFFKILGILGISFVVFFIFLFEYSTSPRFCKSCHIMEPYYKAWETSKHNFVPCVDCHYPPNLKDTLWLKYQAVSQVVKYVTKTYSSKPYAEIEDASCLRSGCHERRLLEGKVTFKRGIIFDHRPHLQDLRRGKQLRCTSCHSQIVVGNHMEVTEGTCFLCHFKGMKQGRVELAIGGCPSCHLPPEQDIKFMGITFNHKEFVGKRHVMCQKCHLDAIQGEGKAIKERCFNCHNQPERIAQFDNIEFMHKNHASERNIECSRCHEEIMHKVKTAVAPLEYDCSVCHESKHQPQKLIYAGVGGKGVDPMPDPMFLAQVDCVGCHIMPKGTVEEAGFKGLTYNASEISCISCHGKEIKGVLEGWKQMVEEKMKTLKKKLEQSERLTKNIPRENPDYRQIYRMLNDARVNYNLVYYGKGYAHNAMYSDALLTKGIQNVEEAMKLISKNKSLSTSMSER